MRISDWSSDVCSSDLGGGYMDIHDPHRLALLVISLGREAEIKADRKKADRQTAQPGDDPPGKGQKARRIGEVAEFGTGEAFGHGLFLGEHDICKLDASQSPALRKASSSPSGPRTATNIGNASIIQK